MFLVERRMSLFWIMRGQRRKSTSLQSLPGLGLESPHSSTIGFEGWLLNTIAPRSLSLAGPFTDRAVAEVLPQQMNFSMPLSLGLATQIRGLDQPGRRAKDWLSSSRIVEPFPQEGRLREPSLQALLRELAAFNSGLCVITTRTPVADIADHEGTSALRRD